MAPAASSTDQVGAILRGLTLDKKYFYKYIKDYDPEQDLIRSISRGTTLGGELAEPLSPSSPKSDSDTWAGKESKGEKKLARRRTATVASAGDPTSKSGREAAKAARRKDFDLYLGEKLVPLLAQGLDALNREVTRQRDKQDKDALMRRFNPMTWLAQYLMRNHPQHAATPRRRKVYANFAAWTDLERGRREVLRRKEKVEIAFAGFVRKRVVVAKDIPKVFKALDEAWSLQGHMANHPLLPTSFDGMTPNNTFTFEQFWDWFTKFVLDNDFLPYEDFYQGVLRSEAEVQKRQQEEEKRKEREELEEERRVAREERKQRYLVVANSILENEELKQILESDKYLTGAFSSLEPLFDEEEVLPFGEHVGLVVSLLIELGFDTLPAPDSEFGGWRTLPKSVIGDLSELKAKAKELKESGTGGDEVGGSKARSSILLDKGSKDMPFLSESKEMPNVETVIWWEEPAISCWRILQRAANTEVQDGVVDRASLAFATDIANYEQVQRRVSHEYEKEQALGVDVVDDANARLREEMDAQDEIREFFGVQGPTSGKKSYQELGEVWELTMARIEWLHDQFKEFLEDGIDNYPEDPAFLTKERMQELYLEMNPDMTDEMFEEKFGQIDADGSGTIEFDEFIMWVAEEEVDFEDEDDEDEEDD